MQIDKEQIQSVLVNEVSKRDVIEGDKVERARKRINRLMNRVAQDKNLEAGVV